ncbi:CRISPR-associated endonuclease Cas2 [Heliorestis convoluta]|uniref:CRISPR-associated endoribonuclease Cas2 n=1 Tax=Heliorestis convoluta TaxID=356322 RepID=A0A5Q2N2D2_9FIRM|nr:CRISPR-associated endonuclease Cas2 [Heliorestis convoluta]QGG48987.1 CRISPR-associated endoribonuclease Cas2 [Heliorestis convoluta]
MLIVVSYDIPNDKRRGKVLKALKSYGEWMQYSVFECNLTKEQYLKLRNRLDKIINYQEDSIRFYTLCDDCKEKIDRIGGTQPRDESVFII